MKSKSWEATEDLDNRISLLVSMTLQKYGVKVKTDTDYSKGTIRIKITG